MKRIFSTLIVMALLATACGGDPAEFEGASSADDFIEVMHSTGFQVLDVPGPDELIESVEASFRGRITGVDRGPRQVSPTDFENSCEAEQLEASQIEGEVVPTCETTEALLSFIQFTVVVTKPISGDVRRGEEKTFQLPIGPLDVDRALAVAPGGEVIVSLVEDDPNAFDLGTREWPNGKKGEFHLTHPAGIWFPSKNGNRAISPFLPVESFGPEWNAPEKFDDVGRALEVAADSSRLKR